MTENGHVRNTRAVHVQAMRRRVGLGIFSKLILIFLENYFMNYGVEKFKKCLRRYLYWNYQGKNRKKIRENY